MPNDEGQWPIFIQDRQGRTIYLTRERWEHVLNHPGMHEGLLDAILLTIRTGRRKQDKFEPNKGVPEFKLSQQDGLPRPFCGGVGAAAAKFWDNYFSGKA